MFNIIFANRVNSYDRTDIITTSYCFDVSVESPSKESNNTVTLIIFYGAQDDMNMLTVDSV